MTIADANWLAQHRLPQGVDVTTAWYLGDDHKLYCRLRDHLPQTIVWGDAGQHMNAVARNHADTFVNLDDGFHISDFDWWELRNIAERGPYSTTFVTDACRQILFNDIIEKPGGHLFAVEWSDLADVLTMSAGKRGIAVRRLGPGAISRARARAYRTAIDIAGFARAVVRRWREIRALHALRRIHPLPTSALRDCDVLIAAWTKANDFPANSPRETAHSMGPLPQWLRSAGVRVGFIALPLTETCDATAIAEKTVVASDAVLHADEGLTVVGLLRTAARALICRAHVKTSFTAGGHDLTGVARMVLAREWFDWRPVNAALWSGIGLFLAQRNIRPKVIFHVYENQTWEKGLRQGIRRNLPETRIVGCQQSPFSSLYPNFLPARAELTKGRWPDNVLALGSDSKRKLTAGASQAGVIRAGLLRKGAFLATRPSAPAEHFTGHRLLCATGPDYQESLELAAKTQAAVIARPETSLVINFHPLTSAEFRKGLQQFLTDQAGGRMIAEFSDASISTLLAEGISAVVYGDTNAGFEAVSAGARAIHVGRDHALSFDKLPDGLARRVWSSDEIGKAIDDLSTHGAWPDQNIVSATLAECFSPPDMDLILATIGRTNSTRKRQ
ncbi:MAG: hypothetical protein RIA64_12945 [Rhodospirillales bacterium]